jgi:riboflavin kinase/FMN adenylyltransferase
VKVIRRWQDLKGRFARPVVALGKFDGVHRGHQKLLAEVKRLAAKRKAPSMAVTFDVHPHSLIRPHRVPPMLSTPEEKVEYIAASGMDALLYLKFTPEFASLTAWEFARGYLAGKIGAGMILAGKNFRFGKNRTGDVDKLRRWGEKLGFEFRVVAQITVSGEPASSTRVRKIIASGDMVRATRLLGRPYAVEDMIYPGEGRGEVLGAPTANLSLPPKLLPPDGVYLVRASLAAGRPAPALVNLGFSPTFKGTERRLEVHVLGKSGMMYGKVMRVYFERFLRGEKSFPSADALSRQIQADLRDANEYFRRKA